MSPPELHPLERETVASGHWFAGLPTSFQQALCGSARVVTLRPGELLFQWVDDNSGLYAMLEGTIRFGAVNLDNVIATNLASALFVMMLRLHLRQLPEPRSMLSLLHDRTTSRVVVAMLKEPSKGWTLNDMAEVAITSRVTLVSAFRRVSGLAPMAYLTALRLDLARHRLSETNESIGEVAATVGYKSEGAFSRAFLRRFGPRPGAFRELRF